MLLYIVIAILMFGILVAVHELGHFLTAKLCGVRVNEFARMEALTTPVPLVTRTPSKKS